MAAAVAPTSTPAPTVVKNAPTSADPFKTIGGGTWTGSGWVPTSNPMAQNYVNGYSAPTPAAAAPAAPGAPAKPAAPPPPTVTSNAAQAQQTISNILQTPLGFNQNDPVFQTGRAQVNLEAQRQREQQQSQAAERLSTQGLNQAGAMDTAALQAQQNEGATRLGGLNTLMNNQAQQQYAQLSQALQLAQGAGLTDQAQKLQERLAQLQAQLQREGYATQTGIAGQSNATNMTLGQGQLNLGLLNALMGNQQFNDNLGANIGMNQAGLSQQYLLSLLNG